MRLDLRNNLLSTLPVELGLLTQLKVCMNTREFFLVLTNFKRVFTGFTGPRPGRKPLGNPFRSAEEGALRRSCRRSVSSCQHRRAWSYRSFSRGGLFVDKDVDRCGRAVCVLMCVLSFRFLRCSFDIPQHWRPWTWTTTRWRHSLVTLWKCKHWGFCC